MVGLNGCNHNFSQPVGVGDIETEPNPAEMDDIGMLQLDTSGWNLLEINPSASLRASIGDKKRAAFVMNTGMQTVE
jgi:hypothetical protein